MYLVFGLMPCISLAETWLSTASGAVATKLNKHHMETAGAVRFDAQPRGAAPFKLLDGERVGCGILT